jgi:hypothetical protein
MCSCVPSKRNFVEAQHLEVKCCDWCNLHSTYYTRRAIRKDFGMVQDPCKDFCVTLFCYRLAVCQDARNLKIIKSNPKKQQKQPKVIAINNQAPVQSAPPPLVQHDLPPPPPPLLKSDDPPPKSKSDSDLSSSSSAKDDDSSN